MWDNLGSLNIFPLLLLNSWSCRSLLIFDLFFSKQGSKLQLTGCLHNHIAHTSLWPGEEAAEKIWRTVNYRCVEIHLLISLRSLAIFRYYFTGNRKVSCLLATISNWFPKQKDLKTKVVSLFSLVIGQNTRVASWRPVLTIYSPVLNFWSHWWPVSHNFEPCFCLTLEVANRDICFLNRKRLEVKELLWQQHCFNIPRDIIYIQFLPLFSCISMTSSLI